MWHKLAAALVIAAGPAAATGIEITVAGEANGTIAIDLLEDTAPQHVARITALAADGAELLDESECQELHALMAELQAAAEGEDLAAIRALTEQLGRASESFAARRMDKSIREALTGSSLDELDQEVGE